MPKGYTIQKYASREEWLKGRELGLGSSDAGTILCLNHYDTPLQLWRRRMRLDPPKPQTAAMSRGHRMEPVVASDFAAATGAIIDATSEGDWHAVDDEKPYLRISPDRLYWEKDTPEAERTLDNAMILECKTCTKEIDAASVFDVFPYWYAQIQYQMGVMRVRRGALAWINVMHPDLPFGYVDVDFDETYYNKVMLPRLDKFWNENIVGGAQPDEVIDSSDANILWNKGVPDSTIVADDELMKAVVQVGVLENRKKEVEDLIEEAKFRIRTGMGEKERLVALDGELLATWKNCRTAPRLDTAALKQEIPDIYDKYLSDGGETRRLTIKKKAA